MSSCHYWCFLNGTVSLRSNVVILLISFGLVLNNYTKVTAASSTGRGWVHNISLNTSSILFTILNGQQITMSLALQLLTPVDVGLVKENPASKLACLFLEIHDIKMQQQITTVQWAEVRCTTIRCAQEPANGWQGAAVQRFFHGDTQKRQQLGYLACHILTFPVVGENFLNFWLFFPACLLIGPHFLLKICCFLLTNEMKCWFLLTNLLFAHKKKKVDKQHIWLLSCHKSDCTGPTSKVKMPSCPYPSVHCPCVFLAPMPSFASSVREKLEIAPKAWEKHPFC